MGKFINLNVKQNIIFVLLSGFFNVHIINSMLAPSHFDTSLAEFTYTVARETPLSLKRRLPEKLFKAIATEKGAMKFATKSTDEQKKELFSYLGLEYYWIFVDKKNGGDIRWVFQQFDTDEKPAVTLKKLGEANIFISSSKQFCDQLGYVAQLMDTTSFGKNAELIRTSYQIKKFKNKLSTPDFAEREREKNIQQEFLKYLQGAYWTSEQCDAETGIDLTSMRILIHLLINKNSYISFDELKRFFAGSISARQLFALRKKLIFEELIQRHPKKENPSVTITGKGILVVNQFRDKVIKSMDF